MNRFRVHSNVIASAGYDALCAILEIQFVINGQICRYLNVPEHIWYGLRMAKSMEWYFQNNIMGRYEERIHIPEGEKDCEIC